MHNITFGWFDILTIATVVVGIKVGRTRGMTVELIPMLQWVTTVIAGAKLYPAIGQRFMTLLHINPSPAYALAYAAVLIVAAIIFLFIRKTIGEKLVGSDFFGRMEFYLGMLAGAIHFFCILLVVVSFLNSRYISDDEREAFAKMQKDNFGSISFPTIGSIQQDVFEKSVSGSWIKVHLSTLLVHPQAPSANTQGSDNIGKQREKAVDDAINGKK